MAGTPEPFSPGGVLHRGVEDAVRHIWNNQYEEAEKLLVARKDTSPRFALEYANMHLIMSLMTASNEAREANMERYKVADGLASQCKYGHPVMSDSSDDGEVDEEDEDRENTMSPSSALSDKERKKAEKEKKKQRAKEKKEYLKQLKEAKKSGQTMDESWQIECDLIYADALFVRSILQLRMNSYIKGAVNLRKTWGYYYALYQKLENPTGGVPLAPELQLAIKFGCGMFYTYLALVPANLMTLLKAIGFISDRDLGEQYLTEVVNSGTIRSPYAALVLLSFYLFLPTALGDAEQTLAKAKVIFDIVLPQYPANSYFYSFLNFYHRKKGETIEAVDAIEKAMENAKGANLVPMLFRYVLADTYYMDLQFEKARDAYHDLITILQRTGETFEYTGQMMLSLAACYMWLGDEASATEWVKKVPNFYNPKSKLDANSPKYAQRLINEPRLMCLMGVYILYINRDLAHMKGERLTQLKAVLESAVNRNPAVLQCAEVKGMNALFVGVMQKGGGDKAGAKATIQEVFDLKVPSDSMVLPYSYYEVGELEYKLGNPKKAKELFEKGMKCKAEGHETLANRFNIALRQIARDKK